jgi:hypothetical protein
MIKLKPGFVISLVRVLLLTIFSVMVAVVGIQLPVVTAGIVTSIIEGPLRSRRSWFSKREAVCPAV